MAFWEREREGRGGALGPRGRFRAEGLGLSIEGLGLEGLGFRAFCSSEQWTTVFSHKAENRNLNPKLSQRQRLKDPLRLDEAQRILPAAWPASDISWSGFRV